MRAEIGHMKAETFFFATRTDMATNLKRIEKSRPIKYVKCGGYDSQNYILYNSVDDFANLGINVTGDHQTESYLVLDADVDVNSYAVKQDEGGVRYFVNQKENDDSIVFWPGGFYGNDYLICGHISTVYNNRSFELYKYFSSRFVKDFKKINRYYVSKEVFGVSPKVRLITININQPKEYDFKIS
jgi:hypothetical protein